MGFGYQCGAAWFVVSFVTACGPGSIGRTAVFENSGAEVQPGASKVPSSSAKPHAAVDTYPTHHPIDYASCDVQEIKPGPSPLRRLTRFEYGNTIRDLLGDTGGHEDDFPAEAEVHGFDNNASSMTVTPALAEQYARAADKIADRATEHFETLMECDPAKQGEHTCVDSFVRRFGRRAWRRPLRAAEHSRLMDFFEQMRGQYEFRRALRSLLAVLLQSPHFLYRVEIEPSEFEETRIVRPNPWEMASRLSYLLWATMPDEALFEAAQNNKLGAPEDIARQARRMLRDPKARRMLRHFTSQWLDLQLTDAIDRDSDLWNPAMRSAMRAETETFVERTVLDGPGDLKTLLTASHTWVNDWGARLYEVSSPQGSNMERVELDPSQRAGLLTHPSILTITAKTKETSPVLRGHFVRDRFLCQTLPPPPGNVDTTLPEPQPGLTTRERLSEHSDNDACSGCHQLMDPIGFGLESYDEMGIWRDEENGTPIDTRGELSATDVDGDFEGAVQLAHALATSQQVAQCIRTHWFHFAYGRTSTEEDTCTISHLDRVFQESNLSMVELIVALTQTNAFLYRRVEAKEGGS